MSFMFSWAEPGHGPKLTVSTDMGSQRWENWPISIRFSGNGHMLVQENQELLWKEKGLEQLI